MSEPGALSIVPILHGRDAFARQVRRTCLAAPFDCIAVDLPQAFESHIGALVDSLPVIHAAITDSVTQPRFYIPADPCDAAIEAVRQARQNRCPLTLVGSPFLLPPAQLPPLPDEHAITCMGFDAYVSLCVLSLGAEALNDDEERSAQYTAWRLSQLRAAYARTIAVVHLRHYTRVIHHLALEQTHNLSFDSAPEPPINVHAINPDHLYFALGELPFAAGRIEQARMDVFAQDADPVRTVKDLFVETRDEYSEERTDALVLPPARIQTALTFLRNLTVMSDSLMPSLFDIVTAARGVGGNSYALRILKSARYYPYLPDSSATLSVGIDQVRVPGDQHPVQAVNLLKDTQTEWIHLPIKHDPTLERRRKYRYAWNPGSICSHVPEDRRIESFNAHVRSKALRVLCEDMVRSEKFTTSVLDGLDMRETLRNWHTGDIYVKQIPPSRGALDSVVIIFDPDHDDCYPHTATWYAEHNEESTLTFYATSPESDMIGPGIARARYGGLALLFPPRPIPSVFSITDSSEFHSLGNQLTYGAMLFARERNVAYVAAAKPDTELRRLANRLHKHLVWIPLTSFSNETISRLRSFHVLNGREVRSWAARFIGY